MQQLTYFQVVGGEWRVECHIGKRLDGGSSGEEDASCFLLISRKRVAFVEARPAADFPDMSKRYKDDELYTISDVHVWR